MKVKLLSFLFPILSVAAITYAVYSHFTKPKIGFVYNNKLLTEFAGVKDSRKIYREKEATLRANADTLEKELIAAIRQYQANALKMSDKEKALNEQILNRKQLDLSKYKETAEAQIRQEDQKLSADVMMQINAYILEYAKEHGYDFIFGTASEGSLFFAGDKYDVTEDVLKGLNTKYSGEK